MNSANAVKGGAALAAEGKKNLPDAWMRKFHGAKPLRVLKWRVSGLDIQLIHYHKDQSTYNINNIFV